jgi:catechol 2,3-dioxygenase-like lactoylglutathione lyase family enzyme
MTDERPETEATPAAREPVDPARSPQGPDFPDGPQLAAVVIYVRHLGQSAEFYCDLLKMKIVARETTALVLAGSWNSVVVLRAVGPRGEHALGSVGVQYACWTAHDPEDLDRCERYLRDHGAHVETSSVEDRTVVEGRDPDGLPVMVVYPPADRQSLGEIMSRAYAW